MTVTNTTSTVEAAGNGATTAFSFSFKAQATTDIDVYKVNTSTLVATLQTIVTDYAVTLNAVTEGGTVTYVVAPTASENSFIKRKMTLDQQTDIPTEGNIPETSLNNEYDKSRMIDIQQQDELDRALKFATTSSLSDITIPEGTSAANRASKAIVWNTDGDGFVISTSIGEYQGNWATTTAYLERDLIKDTSNNNIYYCNTAHTSSGSQPISSNTDVAKWDLIVDAASATSSATAAATSATAAATSATAAATSKTAAETAETNAETAETNAETAETNAETAETNAASSATSAASSASTATTQASAASTSATAAASSASTASTQATNAASSATTATTQATNAATSATSASGSATTATTQATAASTSATNAATSATSAATAQAAAEAAVDTFDDVYLGAKGSAPTLDNDGDPLTAGDLYYNNVANTLNYYTGSTWVAVTSGGITSVSADPTPTLGGDLVLNGNDIPASDSVKGFSIAMAVAL